MCTDSMGLRLPVQAGQGLQAGDGAWGPLHPSCLDAFAQHIRWERLDLDQFLITSALIEGMSAAPTWESVGIDSCRVVGIIYSHL